MADLLSTMNPLFFLIVGLAARLLLLAGVLLVIGLPVLAAIYGWQGTQWAVGRLTSVHREGAWRWRDDCYYAPSHLWLAERPQGAWRIGLDDLAQRLLPDIRTLKLAPAGSAVRAGDAIGEVSCADAVVTLRAPVAGTIESVNERVLHDPDLLHRDPFRAAWLVDVRPQDDSHLRWPVAERARTWLAAEEQRVGRMFEHAYGIAAADGGELVMPAHTVLTPAQWQEIRASVLDAA